MHYVLPDYLLVPDAIEVSVLLLCFDHGLFVAEQLILLIHSYLFLDFVTKLFNQLVDGVIELYVGEIGAEMFVFGT